MSWISTSCSCLLSTRDFKSTPRSKLQPQIASRVRFNHSTPSSATPSAHVYPGSDPSGSALGRGTPANALEAPLMNASPTSTIRSPRQNGLFADFVHLGSFRCILRSLVTVSGGWAVHIPRAPRSFGILFSTPGALLFLYFLNKQTHTHPRPLSPRETKEK